MELPACASKGTSKGSAAAALASRSRAVATLCLVCRAWNGIVCGLPALWSPVNVDLSVPIEHDLAAVHQARLADDEGEILPMDTHPQPQPIHCQPSGRPFKRKAEERIFTLPPFPIAKPTIRRQADSQQGDPARFLRVFEVRPANSSLCDVSRMPEPLGGHAQLSTVQSPRTPAVTESRAGRRCIPLVDKTPGLHTMNSTHAYFSRGQRLG